MRVSISVKVAFLLTLILSYYPSQAQVNISNNPKEAKFSYTDVVNFWLAFDNIDSLDNPFIGYLNNGSVGLKEFIPKRIESPKKLLKVVKRRLPDYESIRSSSLLVDSYEEQIRKAYQRFSVLYKKSVFPTTYYVVGAFNTGGTATESGLVIGVEGQDNNEEIPYVVAHEIVHFNQNYKGGQSDLLKQSIIEGSADFIGQLISGNHPNNEVYKYGNENEEVLCAEFTKIMYDLNYHGWLYGTNGKKKNRPKDLGYWVGYNICNSYYSKANNKQKAIREILNIKDFNKFLIDSGYLDDYFNK